METGPIQWATVSRKAPGETECGDVCVVTEANTGILVAVIDGLGHGREASLAATKAARSVEDNKNLPLADITTQCHEDLKGTRGVVLSLVFFDYTGTMTWIGIGNVEGRLVGEIADRDSSLLLRMGLVGDGQLPVLRPATLPIEKGDAVVMATDGIRPEFGEAIDIALHPEQIASNILTDYAKSADDALVFVATYTG